MAYPHRPIGKLTTSICTRTRPLSEASEDLEYLDKKDDPSHGAGIEGMIELDTRGQPVGPLEGIPVVVEGRGRRQAVVTQKDGRFQLWGLLLGRYRVTPDLPKSFWAVSQSVGLKQNACAELHSP